jgi:hypothetical protein
MKFTRRTYRMAINRSFNKEYEFFRAGFSMIGPWVRQMEHTAALRRRKLRELS